MTSRIVFFFGSSRSRRRRATVTSSQPDASSAPSIASSLAYLPVPRKRRERSSTPATTSGSACVTACTRYSLRGSKLLLHEQLVVPVRQPLHRVLDRQPEQPVDLDARLEPSAARLHDPVARDLVPAAPVDVRGASQRPPQLAAQSGLLPHLAQRAVLGALVRLDLALGQSPVVVLGAVDYNDLVLAGPRAPDHDSSRGSHDAHISDFKDLCCHRCSFVC